jgi:CubicO group peptidase (beta-lactamase class C family)
MPLAALLLLAYFPPPDSKGGWRTREDAALQRRLDEVFDYIQTTTKHGGLAALHDGWLVYERYFGKGNREATPNSGSVGKSFTSIAAGILMRERPEYFPRGLDTKIFTPGHLPAGALQDPAKSDIRLGQLLAMTAGIRGNNPSYVYGKPVTIDPPGPDGWPAMVDRNAFRVTLWCRPGEGYSYATASIHLVSTMLRHISGMELEDYLRKHVAAPLGWGRWGFGYRRPDVDHTPGGGGIALRATDMLRFGYMMLHEGRWGGRQVVPRSYAQACARLSPYNPHFPYSLQFDVNGHGQLTGVPHDAFWKSGSGGHALYIIPSMNLVIWKLGGRDEQYSRSNTGLPEPPYDGSREGWTPGSVQDDAVEKTLRMVVEKFR